MSFECDGPGGRAFPVPVVSTDADLGYENDNARRRALFS